MIAKENHSGSPLSLTYGGAMPQFYEPGKKTENYKPDFPSPSPLGSMAKPCLGAEPSEAGRKNFPPIPITSQNKSSIPSNTKKQQQAARTEKTFPAPGPVLEDFMKHPFQSSSLPWLWQVVRPQAGGVVALAAGYGLFALAGVGFALLSQQVVDQAVAGAWNPFLWAAAGLIALLLTQTALRLFCNGLATRIQAKLEMQLQQRLLKKLLGADYASESAYHSGELQNRLFSDVQLISTTLTSLLPNLVNMVTQLIAAAAVMLTLDWAFTLLLAGAGTLLFLVTRLFRGKIKSLHKAAQHQSDRLRSVLQEMLESLLMVKVFGVQEQMEQKAQDQQNTYYQARMKQRNFSILAGAGFSFVFSGGYLLAMIWGAAGLMTGAMTFGTLTALLQLVNQIQQPFANLSGLLPQYYNMVASAERLMELDNLPPEPAGETVDPAACYRDLTAIRFSRLAFTYPGGERPVLTHAHFTLPKGSFTALTGPSGIGKSTLFKLLLGVYSPDAGSITLELPDRSIPAGQSTRSLFCYVPQGNFLFSGTVRENLKLLRPDATEAQMRQALHTACADEFVDALPQGLDTVMGERGAGLSEGQLQRLAIARALLSGAPVLLLDEATSALDEATEAKVLSRLKALGDVTVLIITHRPAALKLCGQVLRMEEGKVEAT